MEFKVKKITTVYGKYSNVVIYEYRGHRYEVEYANCNNYCVTPAYIQHKNAQAEIDKKIDSPKPIEHPIDWDEIWKMIY